jgi:hypothetical protein
MEKRLMIISHIKALFKLNGIKNGSVKAMATSVIDRTKSDVRY